MQVDVLLLPSELNAESLRDKAVVVFDVLRATTTLAAALTAGVREIRVFGTIDSAREAAEAHGSTRVLCGEVNCLRPPGFDLGNSPTGFDRSQHADEIVFMSTTNGTRAIVAARAAEVVIAGALVNARAVAKQLVRENLDITLLCAGTDGKPALEDLLGAGAVISELKAIAEVSLVSDIARAAARLFNASQNELLMVLSEATGGQNVIAAGLPEDVNFAANLNSIDVVGRVLNEPLRIVPA